MKELNLKKGDWILFTRDLVYREEGYGLVRVGQYLSPSRVEYCTYGSRGKTPRHDPDIPDMVKKKPDNIWAKFSTEEEAHKARKEVQANWDFCNSEIKKHQKKIKEIITKQNSIAKNHNK